MDPEDFQLFVERGRRHHGGNPFRHHRFSRAGWPNHQQVVGTGHGHLDRTAQGLLALDLGKIHSAVHRGWRDSQAGSAGGQWHQIHLAAEETLRAIE